MNAEETLFKMNERKLNETCTMIEIFSCINCCKEVFYNGKRDTIFGTPYKLYDKPASNYFLQEHDAHPDHKAYETRNSNTIP